MSHTERARSKAAIEAIRCAEIDRGNADRTRMLARRRYVKALRRSARWQSLVLRVDLDFDSMMILNFPNNYPKSAYLVAKVLPDGPDDVSGDFVLQFQRSHEGTNFVKVPWVESEIVIPPKIISRLSKAGLGSALQGPGRPRSWDEVIGDEPCMNLNEWFLSTSKKAER